MSGTSGALAGPAAGYRPGRTLPWRVEALRQLRRGRTLAVLGGFALLPWVLVAAFLINGSNGRTDSLPSFLDVATGGGVNFAVFTLLVSANFLLVVSTALFCGDTVAGEAQWSTLKYLLAAPVPRWRLLRQKLTVALAYGAVAVVLLVGMALLAGTLVWGWNPLTLPAGGTQLSAGLALERLAVSVGYVAVLLLVVAALAFWLSTRTDSPLGAVGGAVMLVIVTNILGQVSALGDWRQVLPLYRMSAYLTLFQPEPAWEELLRGMAVAVSYALVLGALAFRGFRDKDVVS